MSCIICGRKKELRFGVCWDCATAQSIIIDGVDHYNKGLDSDNVNSFKGDKGYPAKTSLAKIHLLIQKGWQPPK